jgi:pimeloyl-ACP methyl ester carboxylesterase
MSRFIKWALAALVVIAVGYFAVAGWFLSGVLKNVVTVGGMLGGIATQTADPFALNYDGDPQQAFGLAYEDVTLDSELGPLPAWVVPGATATDFWMVYAHGIAGRRESGYKALSVAQPLGINTLLFSYRNDAGAPAASEGVYGFGVTEWRDLEAAVKLAEARGARRIILAGDSMGGAIIGEFLRNSQNVRWVVAAVLDSPALDVTEVVRGFASRIRLPLPGAVGWVARQIMPWRVGIDFSDAVTLPVLAAGPRSIFVVHGTADSVVPVSVSDELNARRARGMTYLRTGADHVQSWQEDAERYRAALDAFLREVVAGG